MAQREAEPDWLGSVGQVCLQGSAREAGSLHMVWK